MTALGHKERNRKIEICLRHKPKKPKGLPDPWGGPLLDRSYRPALNRLCTLGSASCNATGGFCAKKKQKNVKQERKLISRRKRKHKDRLISCTKDGKSNWREKGQRREQRTQNYIKKNVTTREENEHIYKFRAAMRQYLHPG